MPKDNLDDEVMKDRQDKNIFGASRFLIKDPKYFGKYVAQASFNDREVIAFGDSRKEVREEACKSVKNPVVFYVLNPNEVYLFDVA